MITKGLFNGLWGGLKIFWAYLVVVFAIVVLLRWVEIKIRVNQRDHRRKK